MPLARRRIRKLQTSALQISVVKPLAEIRSKVVPFLWWFGVVKQMAYGRTETDMRAMSWR